MNRSKDIRMIRNYLLVRRVLRSTISNPIVILGALAFSAPLVACGGYAADPSPASGGASASGGDTATASGGDSGTASGGDSNMASGGSDGSGGSRPLPEPSCDNVTACGGEIAQGWFAQKSCLEISGNANLTAAGIGCSEAAITEGSYTVVGNFSVNADMTISDNTSTTLSLSMELAENCKDVSGVVVGCADLSVPLKAGAGFDDMVCANSVVTEGGCTCTVENETSGGMGYPLGNYTAKTNGTYTIDGNTLVVEGTSDDPSIEELRYDFCVDGEFAIMTPTTPTNWGEVKGTIVLQFQP